MLLCKTATAGGTPRHEWTGGRFRRRASRTSRRRCRGRAPRPRGQTASQRAHGGAVSHGPEVLFEACGWLRSGLPMRSNLNHAVSVLLPKGTDLEDSPVQV